LRDIIDVKIKSEEQAMQIFTQIALGLLALHEKGIAHKELIPDTIFVDGFGRFKIGGLVKVGSSKKKL
jgi:serine/threonine protein kinase